jgi:hypothetical protein
MKSKDIKAEIKMRFGFTALVTTGNAKKNPFILARIPCLNPGRYAEAMKFDKEFSFDFRRAALTAVYGEGSDPSQQSQGGNIQPQSIAMSADQWVKAFEIDSRSHSPQKAWEYAEERYARHTAAGMPNSEWVKKGEQLATAADAAYGIFEAERA